MRLLPVGLLLGLGGLASARCGSTPNKNIHALHRAHLDLESNSKTTGATPTPGPEFNQPIKTYVHIINQGTGSEVSDEQVRQQIKVLDEGYKNTSFSFVLGRINRVDNPTWRYIDPGSVTEYEMKKNLHQGGYDALNIYVDTIKIPPNSSALLGYAAFPKDSPANEDILLDGVVLDPGTLPGGNRTKYNLGKTGVHEVGHWFGLLHTFQRDPGATDGCSLYGADFVLDTPPEAFAAFGCEVGRDSCENLAGLDPIHNFMDYSDDSCLNQFTPGQAQRIQSLWRYRTLNADKAPLGLPRRVRPQV